MNVMETHIEVLVRFYEAESLALAKKINHHEFEMDFGPRCRYAEHKNARDRAEIEMAKVEEIAAGLRSQREMEEF